jgi:hypothetical protein
LYKSKQFWRACGNPCDQTFSLTYFAGPCHGCSYQVRDVFDVSLDSASLGVVVQEGRHFTLACPWVLNAAMNASKSPSAMMAAFGIILAILAGDRANAGPDGKDVPRVAFFGFEFINTSLEPTAQAEVKRIRLLDDALRQKLAASGRFEIVDIPSDMTREITSGPAISNCNGCQREFAQRVGANWAAWGMVRWIVGRDHSHSMQLDATRHE